jgi:hypothetical protein
MATSAQKRKWQLLQAQQQKQQLQQKQHPNRNKKPRDLALEKKKGTVLRRGVVDQTKEDSVDGIHWRALFFLGVFPVVMSCIVVLTREDLRDEMEEKGIGRFFRDLQKWNTARAMEKEHDDKQP